VADNGIGRRETDEPIASTGLETALVAALAKQLNAQVSETSSKTAWPSPLPKPHLNHGSRTRP